MGTFATRRCRGEWCESVGVGCGLQAVPWHLWRCQSTLLYLGSENSRKIRTFGRSGATVAPGGPAGCGFKGCVTWPTPYPRCPVPQAPPHLSSLTVTPRTVFRQVWSEGARDAEPAAAERDGRGSRDRAAGRWSCGAGWPGGSRHTTLSLRTLESRSAGWPGVATRELSPQTLELLRSGMAGGARHATLSLRGRWSRGAGWPGVSRHTSCLRGRWSCGAGDGRGSRVVSADVGAFVQSLPIRLAICVTRTRYVPKSRALQTLRLSDGGY